MLVAILVVAATVLWLYTQGAPLAPAPQQKVILPSKDSQPEPDAEHSFSVAIRADGTVTVGKREGRMADLESLLQAELDSLNDVKA